MSDELVSSIDKIDVINRARYVTRWNGIFCNDKSNIAEHTFKCVSYFEFIIKPLITEHYSPTSSFTLELISKCYASIINHDITEVFTGDIRHNIKRRYSDFNKRLSEIEKEIVDIKFGNTFYDCRSDVGIGDYVKIITKLVDILDFSYEALREISLGNHNVEFYKAIERGLSILETFNTDYTSETDKLLPNLISYTIELIKSLIIVFDYKGYSGDISYENGEI